MTTNKELLEWAKKHKEDIELRNKIIGILFILIDIIAVAGFLNYYMLLQIKTAYLAQFFAELGLLVSLMLINKWMLGKVGIYGDNPAMVLMEVLAVAVAVMAVAVMAVAVAVAAAVAVMAAAVAVMVAEAAVVALG